MRYLEIWPSLATGQERVFHLAREGKARRIMIINITILGLLFGLSNLAGARRLDPALPLEGSFAYITPLIFAAAGIMTMYGALAGFCLIYWAAARAFGGPGGFGLIFDLIGVAAVPFWLLAPLLNFILRFGSAEYSSTPVLVGTGLAFIWSFILLRRSLVFGLGLSPIKATTAVICMWIFSVSSIYVFLP